ncbi:hypothetical protein QJS04_geneDACA020970 [Acorus gramineus]|uniref:RNase H type-1 domain-containing protein n=1 Tax=Acorus gramineus TaxID=55184 RepID=A0AAV9B235_ACOGR|nr:hypothetical protein QJS04_geneDACA020970 [Acorus gramineus]
MLILHRIKESIKLRTLNKVFHSALSPYISKIVDAFGVQTTVKKKSTSIVTWLHPVDGWLKLNTDGSLADDPGGYGALIRNSNGDYITSLAGRLDLPSINLLELKAIEQGVLLGSSICAHKLWIECDSTTALAWLNGRGNTPWTAIRSLRNIHPYLDQLEDWKATHIHREGNSPADILAAFESMRGESIFLPGQLWNELAEAIEKDRQATGYKRVK